MNVGMVKTSIAGPRTDPVILKIDLLELKTGAKRPETGPNRLDLGASEPVLLMIFAIPIVRLLGTTSCT